MIDDVFSLKGKHIIIAGANGLIGNYLSKALAKREAILTLLDIDSQVTVLADQINKENPSRCQAHIIDLSNESKLCKIFDAIDLCDGLIFLAADNPKVEDGKKSFSKVETLGLDQWKRSFRNNSDSLFLTIKSLLNKKKIKENASIVLTASTYSIVSPNQCIYDGSTKPIDYVASKSIIPNLTRYLATYLSDKQIRVNCLTPHGIDNGQDQNFIQKFAKLSPMKRMCQLSELEGPVVYLLSQASSYMTGANLIVDGGWTIW